MKNLRCPKCSGRMYIDPANLDEAYCFACGYVEYADSVLKDSLQIPFNTKSMIVKMPRFRINQAVPYRTSSYLGM